VTTLTPARPAHNPTPALRTSHFPDPPPPRRRRPSQQPVDTEGSHERTLGPKHPLEDRQVETIDDLRQFEEDRVDALQVAIWDDAKAAQHQRRCPGNQAHLGSQPALPVSMLARTQHRPLHQCGSAPRARSGRRTAIEQPGDAPWASNRASHRCAHWREIPIASAVWDTTYPRSPSDRQAAGLIGCTPAAGLDAVGAREGGAPAGRASPGAGDAPIPADRRR
jgi:hypothetical protein